MSALQVAFDAYISDADTLTAEQAMALSEQEWEDRIVTWEGVDQWTQSEVREEIEGLGTRIQTEIDEALSAESTKIAAQLDKISDRLQGVLDVAKEVAARDSAEYTDQQLNDAYFGHESAHLTPPNGLHTTGLRRVEALVRGRE